MPINFGSSNVDNVFLGDLQVDRIFQGANVVWERIVAEPLTTSITPTETVQNAFPFTVTLSSNYQDATIYYSVGTGAPTEVYTGPFEVAQNTPYVASVDIPITYWSETATETEAQNNIVYDTRGAMPSAPVPVATVGENTVSITWEATVNTTSYNVYRSTTAGTMGEIISQYQTTTNYTDNNVVGGTTYYYTVRSANYYSVNPSAQIEATPTAPPVQETSNWRYVRFQGYGDQTNTATTRLVEFKANEGTTNHLLGKLPISGESVNAGATIDKATDGVITYASGSYPIWWMGAGIPTLTYDLGADYPLTNMQVWMYTSLNDPRQTRFKLFVSKDNVAWTQVIDYSANTVAQDLTNGWTFDVPTA